MQLPAKVLEFRSELRKTHRHEVLSSEIRSLIRKMRGEDGGQAEQHEVLGAGEVAGEMKSEGGDSQSEKGGELEEERLDKGAVRRSVALADMGLLSRAARAFSRKEM